MCREKNGEYTFIFSLMLECKRLKYTIENACVYMFIKDSIILLCFYNFLGWRCVLAGIYTCEHRAQMANVYNSITVTWASSSKHDEFHFSFSIAQFYESNLISHVYIIFIRLF